MEYEEKCGVKVDVKIPESVRTKLYVQWERWKKGDVECYTTLEKQNLLTRYEHFAIGSGVGLPPDPFKPLALQHEKADLEAVIAARRTAYPPGKEYRHILYPRMVRNFKEVTGLECFSHSLGALYSEINDEGRIQIPKIVAVYAEGGRKIDFGDDVINKLQLPTTRNDLKLWEEVMVREVFDFEGGYRMEFVGISEEK